MWNCNEIGFYLNRIWYKILFTYNLFTGYRIWRTQTGERSPFWCTELIFTCTDGHSLTPPFLIHQSTHYTQDIYSNIPSYWVVHNSPSGCMDYDGCLKSISHFTSMCFYSPLNNQVIFYDVHESHFYYREFNILQSHHFQFFFLNSGESVHSHPNNNGTKYKFNHMYGYAIMNYMRKHITLNFMLSHMNYVLLEE